MKALGEEGWKAGWLGGWVVRWLKGWRLSSGEAPLTVGAQNTTVEVVLPRRLVSQMESLIDQGWFPDMDDLIADAVRRTLETHSTKLIEHHVWQDVEWGLHNMDEPRISI